MVILSGIWNMYELTRAAVDMEYRVWSIRVCTGTVNATTVEESGVRSFTAVPQVCAALGWCIMLLPQVWTGFQSGLV